MFSPDRRWIDAFTNVIFDTMRRTGCPPNSCVEAACIGVGVAAAFGCIAVPIPVAVLVAAGNMRIVLPAPDDMRVGKRRGDGFEGHMVLYFPSACVMSDQTADQFHRPDLGMLVPGPVIGPVDREELAGGGVVADLGNGTTIQYQEMVDNVAWRALPAWRESSALRIRMATRSLREHLAAAPRAGSGRRSRRRS